MKRTLTIIAIIVAIILFIALLTVSFLTPARAQTFANPSDQVVSLTDLDLRKREDLRKLERRLATAIATACGPTSDIDPAGKNDVRRCRSETAKRVAVVKDRIVAARTRSLSVATR